MEIASVVLPLIVNEIEPPVAATSVVAEYPLTDFVTCDLANCETDTLYWPVAAPSAALTSATEVLLEVAATPVNALDPVNADTGVFNALMIPDNDTNAESLFWILV